MNNRRKLIIALARARSDRHSALLLNSRAKSGTSGSCHRGVRNLSTLTFLYGPFRQGMRELGYVEGKNFVIDWRFADGENDRLPGLATELANLKVDVIVLSGTPAANAVHKATSTIPIVIGGVGDPVGSGLVKSLAQPGGNITGLSIMSAETRAKLVEMLLTVVGKLSRLAVLVNPSNTDHIRSLEMVEAAAHRRGIKILRADARTPQEISNAFSWMQQQNADGLIVFLEPLFQQQRSQISDLCAKYRLPAAAQDVVYREVGVLMSYGVDFVEHYRHVATYVDKIFKGVKPGVLPVEQPTKFELVINRKTANALGLVIPQLLLTIRRHAD